MSEQTLVYAPSRDAARRVAEAEAAATIYTDGRRRVRATRMQSAVTKRGSVVTFRPTEIVDDVHRIALMESLGIEFVEVASEGVMPPAPVAVQSPVTVVTTEPLAAAEAEEESPVASAADDAPPEWTPTTTATRRK